MQCFFLLALTDSGEKRSTQVGLKSWTWKATWPIFLSSKNLIVKGLFKWSLDKSGWRDLLWWSVQRCSGTENHFFQNFLQVSVCAFVTRLVVFLCYWDLSNKAINNMCHTLPLRYLKQTFPVSCSDLKWCELQSYLEETLICKRGMKHIQSTNISRISISRPCASESDLVF